MSLTEQQLVRKRDLERFLEEVRVWRDQEAERVASCDRSIQKYLMDIEGLEALIELEKKQKDIITRGSNEKDFVGRIRDSEKELLELKKLEA